MSALEGDVLPRVAPGEDPAELVPAEDAPKMSIIEWSTREVLRYHTICLFRGKALVLREQPYPHYTVLTKDDYKLLAYPRLGGVTRSK